eukprot:1565541-Amphidinium_carterae.1
MHCMLLGDAMLGSGIAMAKELASQRNPMQHRVRSLLTSPQTTEVKDGHGPHSRRSLARFVELLNEWLLWMVWRNMRLFFRHGGLLPTIDMLSQSATKAGKAKAFVIQHASMI